MDTKTIVIDGVKVEVSTETADLFDHCKMFSDVYIPLKYSTEIFVEHFNITYMRDIKDYYCNTVMSRSTWTQHTANTFFRSSQFIDFKCEYESINRHDGIIRYDDSELLLCAEWEIDESSVFNSNGEIAKLKSTCLNNPNAEAFLFTYNIKSDIKSVIKNAYDFWNSFDQITGRLFFVNAIFNQKNRNIKGLRTFIIGDKTIEIWEDLL